MAPQTPGCARPDLPSCIFFAGWPDARLKDGNQRNQGTGHNRVFVLVLGEGEHFRPDQILFGRATSLLRRQTASWDDGEALNYLVE